MLCKVDAEEAESSPTDVIEPCGCYRETDFTCDGFIKLVLYLLGWSLDEAAPCAKAQGW
jgi:hypothetical protein